MRAVGTSPDGTELAYTDQVGLIRNLYVVDRQTGAVRQLTLGDGSDEFPAWSPDGKQIAFTRDQSLYLVPAGGESSTLFASYVTSNAVDPQWALALPATTAPIAGNATVQTPGSTSSVPITSVSTLPVGSQVNATQASVTVFFAPASTPLNAPASTAVVNDAAFTVTGRTSELLTLRLKPPPCGARADLVHRRRSPPRRRSTVKVRGGHFQVIAGHVIAASHLTQYTVAYTCQGTRVTVTQGLVVVTLRAGRHGTVRVRAGHSFVEPA
jgi:hypothetical protein